MSPVLILPRRHTLIIGTQMNHLGKQRPVSIAALQGKVNECSVYFCD